MVGAVVPTVAVLGSCDNCVYVGPHALLSRGGADWTLRISVQGALLAIARPVHARAFFVIIRAFCFSATVDATKALSPELRQFFAKPLLAKISLNTPSHTAQPLGFLHQRGWSQHRHVYTTSPPNCSGFVGSITSSATLYWRSN